MVGVEASKQQEYVDFVLLACSLDEDQLGVQLGNDFFKHDGKIQQLPDSLNKSFDVLLKQKAASRRITNHQIHDLFDTIAKSMIKISGKDAFKKLVRERIGAGIGVDYHLVDKSVTTEVEDNEITLDQFQKLLGNDRDFYRTPV